MEVFRQLLMAYYVMAGANVMGNYEIFITVRGREYQLLRCDGVEVEHKFSDGENLVDKLLVRKCA